MRLCSCQPIGRMNNARTCRGMLRSWSRCWDAGGWNRWVKLERSTRAPISDLQARSYTGHSIPMATVDTRAGHGSHVYSTGIFHSGCSLPSLFRNRNLPVVSKQMVSPCFRGGRSIERPGVLKASSHDWPSSRWTTQPLNIVPTTRAWPEGATSRAVANGINGEPIRFALSFW